MEYRNGSLTAIVHHGRQVDVGQPLRAGRVADAPDLNARAALVHAAVDQRALDNRPAGDARAIDIGEKVKGQAVMEAEVNEARARAPSQADDRITTGHTE